MFHLLLWAGLIAAAGAFAIYTAFPLVYMLDGARKAGVWIPRGPLIVGWLWGILAVFGNVAHNWLIASFIFRDLPREGFTSKRVQRYIDGGAERWGWRYAKAVKWARFLNHCDPGHIDGVPSAETSAREPIGSADAQ